MEKIKITDKIFSTSRFPEVEYGIHGCHTMGNKDIIGGTFDVIKTRRDGCVLFKDNQGLYRTSVRGSYEVTWFTPQRGDTILASDDGNRWDKVKFLETFPEAKVFQHCCINPNQEGVSDYAQIKKYTPKVLFKNCVGEVFTEDNIDDKVYWMSNASGRNIEILGKPLSVIHPSLYKAHLITTDIFKSKKSLFTYLASQED